MGMPKKGTRLICVDQISYRVKIHELLPGLRLIVQSVKHSGAVLIIHSEQDIAETHLRPSMIANAIETAIAAGWEPRHSGVPCEIDIEFVF